MSFDHSTAAVSRATTETHTLFIVTSYLLVVCFGVWDRAAGQSTQCHLGWSEAVNA